MTSYFPTLSVIAAAGFTSFRHLYRQISTEGYLHEEFYTIIYVDSRGLIQKLIVPVIKVISNSMQEISALKRRR